MGQRESAASHHATFHRAFVAWRMPPAGQPAGDPAYVAQALQQWLADCPDQAALLQQLAAGAVEVATAAADWSTTWRLAQPGLDASRIGALASPQRLLLAALLALQAARAAIELDDIAGARWMLEQAGETLQQVEPQAPMPTYLRWLMDLLAGELAEAALEHGAAAEHYTQAARCMQALESDAAQLQELLLAWVELLYGPLQAPQIEQAGSLLSGARADARMRTVLGLARVSGQPGPAHQAIELCATQGLPLHQPVLATQGILGALPRDRIDAAAERLLAAARSRDEPWRTNWLIALHAQHADACIDRGNVVSAARAIDAALCLSPKRSDGISITLGLAARVRLAMAQGDAELARRSLRGLLAVRAGTAAALAGSRWNLPFRAACEAALQACVQADAQRLLGHEDDGLVRRSLSLLLDALRSPQDGAAPDDLAGDRITRLATALAGDKALADWRVLVLQSVGGGTMLLCIGGDPAHPVQVSAPDRALQSALQVLGKRSAEALQAWVPESELQSLGRAAYDALPQALRERLARAGTLILVPDFSAGQDRVPIELMHDGEQLLGTSKVIARCLSLAHALRVVEAPLLSRPQGRHGLCVRVSQPPGWTPLQHAEAEVGAVGELLRQQGWDVAQLLESDAEAQTVLELLPLAHLLHIACHGEASAGAEALVLAGGGRLTALEFATRHPLRCVTYLNACSLARGRYLGGGVSRGLAYALARSGAPAVLANLSPVEDASAAQLAEAFYLAAKDLPVGQALRQARQLLQATAGSAMWSPTVLLGDPLARIGGARDAHADATARLFAGEALPTGRRLTAAKKQLKTHPGDLRLAAAIRFADTLAAGDAGALEGMVALAREIGHDIGEAHALMRWADALRQAGDRERLPEVLARAVAALQPLRGTWEPAFEAHTRLQQELRALDAGYQARELPSLRLPSGMSVNDRSDPAVDAVLRMMDAMHEQEAYWRGAPSLHAPDVDLPSAAHNMVVWGYLQRLYDRGSEAGYALQCAERLVWRGLVPAACVPDLARVLAGLLHFLWGQQRVKHLEHWLLRAQVQVILLALHRLPQAWSPPHACAGAVCARELSARFDQMVDGATESKFARARAALRGGVAAQGSRMPELAQWVQDTVQRCRLQDPKAAADLGAWVLGDVMQRIDAAERAGDRQVETLLAFRSLFDLLVEHEEDWVMPYLMEGFEDVRATGGQDLFDRWSRAMA
jgi:CHAT domain-containing protein